MSNVADSIRSFFGSSNCVKLIKYDGRTLEVSGVDVQAGSVKVELGKFDTSVNILRPASEVALSLDDYQVTMCRYCSNLGKKSPEYNPTMQKIMAAVGLITSFRMTLAATLAIGGDFKIFEDQLKVLITRMIDLSGTMAPSAPVVSAPSVSAPGSGRYVKSQWKTNHKFDKGTLDEIRKETSESPTVTVSENNDAVESALAYVGLSKNEANKIISQTA